MRLSTAQLASGEDFILSAPEHVPALWGRERDVLWAQGESLWLVGPQGIGKTSVLQQLSLRRAGVIASELLGLPVEHDAERLVLYLALDRPQQIARSFRRMVDETSELRQLRVWRGPLPFNLAKTPELLAELVAQVGEHYGTPVGTLAIDSVKDIASPLSSDDVGAAVNRAIGLLIGTGIEVIAAHHQRKATSENKRPTSLSDVYGSTWLTAGAGSVLLLWGEPGDPIVDVAHLKQPAEDVGPFEIEHDHERGVSTRRDRVDAWIALQRADGGITASDATRQVYGRKPSRSEREKVRRKLERFVTEGSAERVDPDVAAAEVLYRRVTVRDGSRDASRGGHAPSRTTANTGHAVVTHSANVPPLKCVGKRDASDDVDLDAAQRVLEGMQS
jgi:replicative DNA helicase